MCSTKWQRMEKIFGTYWRIKGSSMFVGKLVDSRNK